MMIIGSRRHGPTVMRPCLISAAAGKNRPSGSGLGIRAGSLTGGRGGAAPLSAASDRRSDDASARARRSLRLRAGGKALRHPAGPAGPGPT
eukprot:8270-Hanusia_phi.AAC.1